jgi:hypothetical protein
MQNNTSGWYNTAIGNESLRLNTTGGGNVSIGFNALNKNRIGGNNTAIGQKALENNTEGNANVSIGDFSGSTLVSGFMNVFIGSYADGSNSSISNSVAIGAGSKIDNSNSMAFGNIDMNKWVFGRSNTSDAGYAFQVGSSTSNGNGAFLTNGGTWTNASSRAFKDNFEDLSNSEILSKVSQLNIQKWKYKGTDETHIGPIAEEFKELFELGVKNDKEHISTIDASGVALKAIQALMEEVRVLKEKISELEKSK